MVECSIEPYFGNEPFIFVSYAHLDAHLVYPIIERLVLDGYRIWYDKGIHAGEDWTEMVAERLDDSSICLAMLTENSVDSVNCRNEISYSIRGGKTLIGIMLTDFPIPKGLRLQLGNTLYLERFRYGETEFYERLSLSHGLSDCRADSPRITDGQLMAWRNRWSNVTPITEAKGSKTPFAEKPTQSAAPAQLHRKSGKKRLLLFAVILILLLAAAAAAVLFRLPIRNGLPSGTATQQSANEVKPTASDRPHPQEEPAEETSTSGTSSEWVYVYPETSGTDVQILSYRYRGGPEIDRIEFYSYGGVNGGCEFDVYFEKNKQIADIYAAVYFGGPVSDEDIELWKPHALKELKTWPVPFGTQNPIGLDYGPILAKDMTRQDNSDFLLWFGVNIKGEIVSTMVIEVGVPLT